MKKTALFIVLTIVLAVLLSTAACTKEQPPDDGTPAPKTLDGAYDSEFGVFIFNGDGRSVVIGVTEELAAVTGLPAGSSEGSYVFLFRNEEWRRDMAETFRITIGDKAYSFRNSIGIKADDRFGFYVEGRAEAVVFVRK